MSQCSVSLAYLVLLLSVVLSNGETLFKCVAIFECTKRPCTLLKKTKSVSAIDRTLIKDLYEEIKVLSSKRAVILFKGSISNLHNLEKLKLSNTKITRVDPGAFHDLPNLEVLDMAKNLIEEVREGVFNVINITELNLQGNKIRMIDSRAFDGMEYLEVVYLDNNRLTTVDPEWFKDTPNVQYISIKQNRIEELQKSAFKNIKGSHVTYDGDTVTTDIFLSKNRIKSIDPLAFENFQVLGELALNSNKLHNISDDIFKNFKHLDVLSLSKNKLQKIPKSLVGNTTQIEYFDLTFNKITCLPYEIVRSAKKTMLMGNRNLNCTCLGALKAELAKNNSTNSVRYLKRNCKKIKKKKKLKKKPKKKKKQPKKEKKNRKDS